MLNLFHSLHLFMPTFLKNDSASSIQRLRLRSCGSWEWVEQNLGSPPFPQQACLCWRRMTSSCLAKQLGILNPALLGLRSLQVKTCRKLNRNKMSREKKHSPTFSTAPQLPPLTGVGFRGAVGYLKFKDVKQTKTPMVKQLQPTLSYYRN